MNEYELAQWRLDSVFADKPCVGACCLADDTCVEVVDEGACTEGEFLGFDTDCTPNACVRRHRTGQGRRAEE